MLTLTQAARTYLPQVDTVIFDVDGVLLDVSQSIRAVNCLSIPAYLRTLPQWTATDTLISSEEIELFKRAGGFNDDWDLTCAAVLLYLFKSVRYGAKDADALHPKEPTLALYTEEIALRGGWLAAGAAYLGQNATATEWAAIQAQYEPALIHRLFQELWAGDWCERVYGYKPVYYPGPGKVRLDRPLLDTNLLPATKKLGILTGRTLSEARVALEMCGLTNVISLPRCGITQDDGHHKPHPGGLKEITVRLGARVALYIGDTRDDLRTVLAFRDLPEALETVVLSAQVLTGTVGDEAPALFAGADIIAEDVNAVLRLLTV